jgi:hypothetical protein
VEGASPELKNELETYRAATSAEARKFAGVEMVVTFPGLRPYVVAGVGRREPIAEFNILRDNWWGELRPDPDVDFPNFPRINWGPPPAAPPPKKIQKPIFGPFLTSQERGETSKELKRLESIGPAPNYLASRVIAWARAHKEDPRLPRALHIVVESPHAGWSDKETANFSHAAFTLLHQNYPDDPWAKKTKYWYR